MIFFYSQYNTLTIKIRAVPTKMEARLSDKNRPLVKKNTIFLKEQKKNYNVFYFIF